MRMIKMIKQSWFATHFSKVLFIFLLACVNLMLGGKTLQMQQNNLLCCVFNTDDRENYLLASGTTFLFASLLVVGLLAAAYKAMRTQQEVNKLLAHEKNGVPANIIRMASEFNIVEEIILVNIAQPLACCFGFLRPRICLSSGAVEQLSADELKATILHEVHHCREFDPLRLLLIKAISSSLFFLPVVSEWGRNYEIDTELNADRFAIQHAGRAALAGAIHRFATLSPSSGEGVSAAIFSGFNGNAVRVAELLGGEGPRRQISVRSLVVSGLSVLLICTFLLG